MAVDRPESVSLKDWLRKGGPTTTLVLSDVVRSTAFLYSTGSVLFMQAIEAHRERARKLIESLGGRVIDTSGDAVFAGFHGVGDAVRYASSILEDSGNESVRVRIGIHEGVVHAGTDGIFGKAVHFAARIRERAGESEVWCSDAAKTALEADAPELAAGLPWRRLDDCELKGVPGRHTLWCFARETREASASAPD